MKVSEIKRKVGYRTKGPCCGNCKHFHSEKEEIVEFGMKYTKETHKVCLLNHFAVGKAAWCRDHEWREDEP